MRLFIIALFLFACGSNAQGPASDTPPPADVGDPALRLEVAVEAHGYYPSELHAKAGARVQLVVTRTADKSCGTVFKIPSLGIERSLPLNERVAIELTMPSSGSVRFTCGMDMFEGTIIATP